MADTEMFRVTLKVIKQFTVWAVNEDVAIALALASEDVSNIISVDVEDQYKIDINGKPIE